MKAFQTLYCIAAIFEMGMGRRRMFDALAGQAGMMMTVYIGMSEGAANNNKHHHRKR